MRYFLELAYNGADYHGWQTQPNAISVQSVLEEALSKLNGTPILITGAGRTDAGVSARTMFAHFDSDKIIEDETRFLGSLNSMIGKNIRVKGIIPVHSDAHARFDASERTYKYFITYKKNPFLHDFCYLSPRELDLELMNEGAEILINTTDFTSFAKLHSDVKTNICDVREAKWKNLRDDEEARNFLGILDDGLVFTISADRFLRNMVRAIVGTLLELGKKKISISQLKDIIQGKNRSLAGTSMPAHALFLWDVKYPYLNS